MSDLKQATKEQLIKEIERLQKELNLLEDQMGEDWIQCNCGLIVKGKKSVFKCADKDDKIKKLEAKNFELKAAVEMMQVLGNKQAAKLIAFKEDCCADCSYILINRGLEEVSEENKKLYKEIVDNRLNLEGNIKCTLCGAVFPDPHSLLYTIEKIKCQTSWSEF